MTSLIAKYSRELLHRLDELKGRSVLIVGDIGLDEYVWGQARRISPEAPVPVVEVQSEEHRLGLSGNVAQNISGLGAKPILVSVVGQDEAAEKLRTMLRAAGASDAYLKVDPSRPTTRKTRVMVQNHHIVRVDYERRQFITAETRAMILQTVKEQLPHVCAVIIQDYAKGVVSRELVAEIVALAKAHPKVRILADPNRNSPLEMYAGVELMTPNNEESVALTGIQTDDLRPDAEILNRIGAKLMGTTGAKQMVITRGKDGMRIFEPTGVVDMPTFANQVADVTGAGDTVIATLALAWGAGFSLQQACALANLAAGVVVAKLGCVPCDRAELLHEMKLHSQEA